MAKFLGYVSVLFWTCSSMIFGLFLFFNGFLVRRVALTKRSNCSLSPNDSRLFDNPFSTASLCLKPRARVIILIVDALKYEFIHKFVDDASVITYHRNKVPVIAKTLQQYPQHSRAFKFLADPPTTTMQRLKGITTGTLPTFIDIHDNFAAHEIVEDNLIDQNVKHGNIFMGDDTWSNLYPHQFLRQYPAPSFDVSDLDTVDNLVKKQIFKEMKNFDWVLLIGHMLGVDHCGHKYGMHHPEMMRKLNETNSFIEKLIQNMNNKRESSMLFVIGDHGMTESGDHGGDSPNEIEAAMFVYSTVPLIDINNSSDIFKKLVYQVDIVPTISVILGNPIPFSNIGNLILEALPRDANLKVIDDFYFVKHSLWKNIFQVQNYLDTYLGENFLQNNLFEKTDDIYQKLLRTVKSVKSNSDLKNFINLSDDYFTLVRKILYKAWVQFDTQLMLKGILLFFCATSILFIIVSELSWMKCNSILESSSLNFILCSALIAFCINSQLYWMGVTNDFINSTFFFVGIVSMICFARLLLQNWKCVARTGCDKSCPKKFSIIYLSRLVFLSISIAVFSNSFIIEENKIILYFLVTLFYILFIASRTKNFSEKGKNSSSEKNFSIFVSTVLILIICIILRSSSYYWRYREEQLNVKNNELIKNFVIGKVESILSNNHKTCFVFIAVVILAIYVTMIQIWLCHCGNLTGYSLNTILARFFPRIIVILTAIYWISKIQQNLKTNSKLLQRINSLPLLIYLMVIIAVSLVIYQPLAVYLLPKEKKRINLYEGETLIPKIYDKMKNILYKKNEDKNNIPIVYGLGTIYSAYFLLVNLFLCHLYILLLGFVLAPTVILMNLVCVGFLYISSVDRIHKSKNIYELMKVSNTQILCWFLIAEYSFYATGHQPAFSTIHWDAGFTGIDNSFKVHFFQAVLIGINTFGSHIILGIALPLLVIIPFTLKLVFPNLIKSTENLFENPEAGELVLFKNSSRFHTEIFCVMGKYILLHAIRVFFCMMTATVNCRHLMVWNIFAPKLLFEGISFLVTIGSILTSLLLLSRVESCIEKLMIAVNMN